MHNSNTQQDRNIFIIKILGLANKNKHTPDTDSICIRDENDYMYIGLSSGKPSGRYCRAGGKICLEIIAAYIHEVGFSKIYDCTEKEEHIHHLIDKMQQALTQKSKILACDIKEFGVGFSVLVFDSIGRYLTFQLGNGCIVGISAKGQCRHISAAEHGININTTWNVTSPYAKEHLKIDQGSLSDLDQIILTTDGARSITIRNNLSLRFCRICSGNFQNVLSYIQNSPSINDYSCILIDLKNLRTHPLHNDFHKVSLIIP